MTASRRVALHDVAAIERDVVEPTAIESGTLYVGLENIESGGRLVGVRPVDAGELASSKFAFTPQHLLYGKLRPYLAKIARPDFEGICSTDILPLLPGPNLDRGYLAWLLLTPEMVALASSLATGANLPRLSPHALAELKIPLPPLPKQRRIAEILDKADALRARRRAALAQLDTLAQSIFLDMFGNPATNPKGWPRSRLRELGKVKTGGTPPSAKTGMFDGPIPFVTPGDLESDVPVKRSVTEAGAAECETARPGATLVCCIGATIGKIGRAEVRSAFNQQINAVEWGESVHDAYGYAALRFFKPTIIAWGASTTLPILKKSAFEKIEIPVPTVELQVEFAARSAKVDKLERSSRTFLAHCDDLFASLQTRAFQGEL